MDYHRPEVQQRIRQLMVLIFSLITCATVTIIQPLGHGKKDPEPYHTSALSGEAWVIELLVGHPDTASISPCFMTKHCKKIKERDTLLFTILFDKKDKCHKASFCHFLCQGMI